MEMYLIVIRNIIRLVTKILFFRKDSFKQNYLSRYNRLILQKKIIIWYLEQQLLSVMNVEISS